MLNYRDFSIRFLPADDRTFQVLVNSPAGDVQGTVQLPQNVLEGGEPLLQSIGQRIRSREPATRALGARRDPDSESNQIGPQQLGYELFAAVFHGPLLSAYEQSLGMLSGSKDGLRVRLIMDPNHRSLAELSRLPWELMCRENTANFVSLGNRSQLVRFLEVPRPYAPLAFKPPFRVLVAMANPVGVAPLDLEHEIALIEDSWGSRSDVHVDYLQKTTRSELQRQLGEADYHVLHFMGHGNFDQNSGRGELILEKEDGAPDHISGEALGVLMADEPTLKLAFLNACNTAQASGSDQQDPFAGVASALVLAGVPAVVAMQFPISDDAAIAFSKRFYEILPQCYALDYVVSEARKAVYQLQENTGGMEWATPAVFMRSPDGMIFESVYRKEPLSQKDSQTYSRLGAKVRQFWIEGKLDRDIPIKPPVELNKELVPNAVQRTFPGQQHEEVPAGKTTATLFDEKERSLLILGAPGYGKTIALLALAQYLLQRYDQDPSEPIPVVLCLSTWGNSKLSIEDWAAREVFEFYKISDVLCKEWIESGRIVLLLDGLDEVEPANRGECIKAINALSEEQIRRTNFHGLAVCCRYDEYERQSDRINFEGAIRLQQLTPDQIRRYLKLYGDQLTGLLSYLEKDPTLLADAQSPLILGMLSVAYRLNPESFSELADDVADDVKRQARHKAVVDTYLQRVFAGHHDQSAGFTRNETIDGLAWLARKLKQHNKSVFLIENIQPNWLSRGWERVLNHALFSMAIGIIIASALAVIWRASVDVDPPGEDRLPSVLDAHRWWYVIAICWAAFAILWEDFQIRKVNQHFERPTGFRGKLAQWCVHTVVLAVVYGAIWSIVALAIWYALPLLSHGQPGSWLSHPIQSSVSVSLIFALRGRSRGTSTYIGTSEALHWSWQGSFRGALCGLAGGFLLMTGAYLFNTTATAQFFLPLWLVIGFLFGGFCMDTVKTKTRPNEGIILSLKNSLLAAGIVGPLLGAAVVTIVMAAFPFSIEFTQNEAETGLTYTQTKVPKWSWENFRDKLSPAIRLGSAATLISFLWFGGIDVLRHYALRLTLKLTGNMPLNLPKFFDQAADLTLLQRIGGGYIFQNHLLKDHFEQLRSMRETEE